MVRGVNLVFKRHFNIVTVVRDKVTEINRGNCPSVITRLRRSNFGSTS
jgi:hypothetical protein